MSEQNGTIETGEPKPQEGMSMIEQNGTIETGEPKPQESKDLVITITMSPDKPFMVGGPGNGKYYDEMVCLYMLEKAKDHIKMSNAVTAKKEQPVITRAGRFSKFWPNK